MTSEIRGQGAYAAIVHTVKPSARKTRTMPHQVIHKFSSLAARNEFVRLARAAGLNVSSR